MFIRATVTRHRTQAHSETSHNHTIITALQHLPTDTFPSPPPFQPLSLHSPKPHCPIPFTQVYITQYTPLHLPLHYPKTLTPPSSSEFQPISFVPQQHTLTQYFLFHFSRRANERHAAPASWYLLFCVWKEGCGCAFTFTEGGRKGEAGVGWGLEEDKGVGEGGKRVMVVSVRRKGSASLSKYRMEE